MSERGHLSARPVTANAAPVSPAPVGPQKLELGSRRDSYIYVPEQYRPDQPMPLVLLLHGAGGHAHDGLRIFLHLADHAGLILVAPASHASTSDIITRRSYGPDLAVVDRTLEYVFTHYAADTAHLGIGGFSDGASYALTLGLANGVGRGGIPTDLSGVQGWACDPARDRDRRPRLVHRIVVKKAVGIRAPSSFWFDYTGPRMSRSQTG